MNYRIWIVCLAALMTGLLSAACDDGGGASDGDTDTDTDSDGDTDTDTDSDSDTDTDTDGDTDPQIFPESFARHTVDDACNGAAWISVADVTGDDQPDIVVSAFGSPSDVQMRGSLYIYSFDGDLDTWSKITVVEQASDLKFPNQTRVVNVDGDDDLDIIVPGGFLACTMGGLAGGCGSLSWWENNGDGTSWTRHDIVPFGSDLFYHEVQLVDLDGDAIDDLVTVGEEMGGSFPAGPDQAITGWFKGTGTGDEFELTPRVIGAGLGSLPAPLDIDDDGDIDFASAEYFVDGGSFAWMEQIEEPSTTNPAGLWQRHVIDNTVGPSIKLAFIEDLYGDGVTRAVGSNHTNVNDGDPESAVYVYDIPEDDPTVPWDRAKISEGVVSVAGTMMSPMAAPGVFGWGDIDGDGDLDIPLSGDGDKRFFILEQLSPGVFATTVIEDPLGQAGGMKVVDLDNDGNSEVVVTGYEANAVYVYEWEG